MPPHSRNHRLPTAADTPASTPASSLATRPARSPPRTAAGAPAAPPAAVPATASPAAPLLPSPSLVVAPLTHLPIESARRMASQRTPLPIGRLHGPARHPTRRPEGGSHTSTTHGIVSTSPLTRTR